MYTDLFRVAQRVLLLIIFIVLSYEGKSRTLKDSLFVFIGEKISLERDRNDKMSGIDTIINGQDTLFSGWQRLSFKYDAKYRILDKIYGDYDKDTIDFILYDHEGNPEVAEHNTVMVFVSKHNGVLYHETYQYFPMYMTTEGRWASPYSVQDYNHPYRDSITVEPEIIPFKDEVYFSVIHLHPDKIAKIYSPQYFEIRDRKAYTRYGNYPEDLFKLKLQTVLKARGIYIN
ncbi:hypothetical protein [Sphingobacterium tabacisoli]|uniref:Uncharacterized protein n=1 Tax=Sphingobacterium tabacisoli TaxID=2044855 RepID=A0ABW5L6Y7_9SPHI|nr:hypothetical protein [Sphingobacterium tabacisoli]